MRVLYLLLLLAFVGTGSWWLYRNKSQVHDFMKEYSGKNIDESQFLTLEARFTPDQILEAHRNELSIDHSSDKPQTSLNFFPYLLLDITYHHSDRRTREGVMLWSMDDGEIVTNMQSWETSKGFGSLLAAEADEYDFQIFKVLSFHQGKMQRDELIRNLGVDSARADDWLESARLKGLISLDGNTYKLRMGHVNIDVAPFTKINQRLVTKPYSHVKKQATQYDKDQITQTASIAFGPDITIRSVREVFLPVYSISSTNPDGSIQYTYWNALNGQRYAPKNTNLNNPTR